eukprot:67373_1
MFDTISFFLCMCQIGMLTTSESGTIIENALVVIVGVGKYENKLMSDISVPVQNDLNKMFDLWSDWAHTIAYRISNYGLTLYEDEFKSFTNDKVKLLLSQNIGQYDGRFPVDDSIIGDDVISIKYNQLQEPFLTDLQISYSRINAYKKVELYDNGIYEGEWVNGKRGGKGKYIWNKEKLSRIIEILTEVNG